MSHRSLTPRRRASLARPILGAFALALSIACPVAEAAVVRDTVQPLGIVSQGSRPSCASPVAPLEPTDIVDSELTHYLPKLAAPAASELSATTYGAEFLPALSICSPTFAGIPGPITGTVASAPKRTRLGAGWRELGSTLLDPAALSPGDTLVLPEVDDAAQLRLSVARTPARAASTIRLTDLAPGPVKLSIGEDARGLIATLTRADGTTAEGIAKPAAPPTFAPTVSGTARRWKVSAQFFPGTIAYFSSYFDTGAYDQDSKADFRPADASGVVVSYQRVPKSRRTVRGASVYVVAANREAQTFESYSCRIRANRRGRPTSIECEPNTLEYDYEEEDVQSPFGNWGTIYTSVRRLTDLGSGPLSVGLRALASRPDRPSTGSTPSIAHRNAVMGRSAAPATAPLVAREITLAPAARAAGFNRLRPLGADINGDRAPDFWTDQRPTAPSWLPSYQGTAGYLLVSGPDGLSPHRVDLQARRYEMSASDSELSAIDDITGDGVGELIVDVRERHALIPGSRTWSGTTAPIRVSDPADLDPSDVLLAPSVSSPGSPYAALDDATGDGRRELSVTDDLGGFFSVSGDQLRRGELTRFPTVSRALPAPNAIRDVLGFETAAPRVDPRVRVISGQAVTLRWPVLASVKAPEGTVEIAVRDARGTDARPPIRVKTQGNAVLLDYDRPSGDVLLLVVGANCIKGRDYLRGKCREQFLRVRADGSIRQTLTVNPRKSIVYVGASRFITDGPDGDGDADVVFTVGNRAVGLAASTEPAVLSERALPTASIGDGRAPFYEELRLIPVVEPGGARTLTAALSNSSLATGYNWAGDGSIPAAIAWK